MGVEPWTSVHQVINCFPKSTNSTLRWLEMCRYQQIQLAVGSPREKRGKTMLHCFKKRLSNKSKHKRKKFQWINTKKVALIEKLVIGHHLSCGGCRDYLCRRRGRSSPCRSTYQAASSSRSDWRTGCCSCSPAGGHNRCQSPNTWQSLLTQRPSGLYLVENWIYLYFRTHNTSFCSRFPVQPNHAGARHHRFEEIHR